jgi:EAL domain-containing protein (putative c-di-GMP-specific phosphodiesterase class I)
MSMFTSTQTIDISQLIHWYQPIKELDKDVVLGYEALVRTKTPRKFSPLDLFKQAENEGTRNYLDCQLLYKAANSMAHNSQYLLFLNVFPSTLLEEWFLPWWDENIIVNSHIVLEVSESEPISDWNKLKAVICELRMRGVKIALDDMGAGYCFFQHWIELSPDYIKLDSYYSLNLAQNELKQKVLKSLISLFYNDTEIILEGIETNEDLDTAKSMGITCAQGYLLGRPSPLETHSFITGL